MMTTDEWARLPRKIKFVNGPLYVKQGEKYVHDGSGRTDQWAQPWIPHASGGPPVDPSPPPSTLVRLPSPVRYICTDSREYGREGL